MKFLKSKPSNEFFEYMNSFFYESLVKFSLTSWLIAIFSDWVPYLVSAAKLFHLRISGFSLFFYSLLMFIFDLTALSWSFSGLLFFENKFLMKSLNPVYFFYYFTGLLSFCFYFYFYPYFFIGLVTSTFDILSRSWMTSDYSRTAEDLFCQFFNSF